jgi:intraflagellar transport protein 140
LDVLEVCLSNFKFTRGIKALRESKSEKEIETRLAIVAMHMGMLDDAKIFLQQVNRWDVLSKFYITIGEYENAIKSSKEFDRINLENTYYRIAEHYERINEIEKAIEHYKLSGCGVREIPRMLVQKGKIDMLEQHMGKGEDAQSIIWWASYLESQGDIEKALANYKKGNDWTNYVRLLISSKRISDAKEICDTWKNQGACFLLGKYYETLPDIRNAIYYYTLSGRISYAFRIARQNNMDPEIYNLGLKAPTQTQYLIAEYFEKKAGYEKAITLYLLSGNIKKAMNLCLIAKQYDKIREIADSVEFRNDSSTLRALAEYFTEQQQYEKALSVYIKLKDYNVSIKICENHKIRITLQTANAIIEDLESETNQPNKLELIGRLAKLLMMQGDFEPSHQIFVKLGNLKKAMKCLIKMGVKDRVIEFANTCRMPELYILAANFLQSLDWIENDEIVKIIVNFYTRAKAYLNLANFYELIANVEINEFRNYEKSVVLYQEALNALEKFKDDEDKKISKMNNLINKIKVTKLFLHVMSIIKSNEEESIKLCNDLLNIVIIKLFT